MDESILVGELTALMDEAVPPRDLGLCFSYTITDEPYHTQLANANSYDEIRATLTEMGINLLP
jgi:hypothetical protein